MNSQKLSITKPIVSIKEICQMVGLSRARFYQLLDSGFFPKPKYDKRSGRPYFDSKLQKQILEARQSGIGADGSYMLFYSSRKKESPKSKPKTVKKTVSLSQEFAETLESMGLDCSEKEVDTGLVIRELFRFLKAK